MKKIFLSIFVLVSIISNAQNKYHDVQRIDSLYAKLTSGTSTDSVVTVDANGKIRMRNASAFGGISGITADNGLTANTSTNVQLGGSLLDNTTITTSPHTLTISGIANTPLVASSSSGTGAAFSSISGVGIQGTSVSSFGGDFRSYDAGTANVSSVLKIHRETANTAANGIGGSIDYYSELSDGNILLANQLVSKWTDATNATRTSQFSITGVNSGTTNTLLTLDGDQTATFFGNVHLNNSGSLYLQTTNSFSGDMPANSQPVINSINSNRVEAINLGAYTYVLTSAAASLSLSSNSVYSFTGTTSTWTLPAITSNTGMSLVLKNRGSGTITLNTNAGATDIYDTSAISTMNITAGQCIRLVNDGTYWIVISKY